MDNVIKEIFIELLDRFESTENLQALVTLENYFEDFNFGLSKIEKNYIKRKFKSAINDLST